jgi:hypothetical protein
MTLYEFYQYTDKEIIEVEYLLEQSKRFDILDKVREALFQFPPSLLEEEHQIPGFGEHERWSDCHKEHIASEIIYYLIEKNFEGDYTQEDLMNEHIWDRTYKPFMEQNDLRTMNDEEINEKFLEYSYDKCKTLKDK